MKIIMMVIDQCMNMFRVLSIVKLHAQGSVLHNYL